MTLFTYFCLCVHVLYIFIHVYLYVAYIFCLSMPLNVLVGYMWLYMRKNP